MPKEPYRGYELPAQLTGHALKQVCFDIPDVAEYRRAFWGKVFELTNYWVWDKDTYGDFRNKEAAEYWEQILTTNLYRFLNNEECGTANECHTYPPSAPFIQWFPNDPFNTPTLVPDGYIFPPWYISGTISSTLFGALNGDILSTIERFPAASLPDIVPSSGLPRFRINVSGSGLVKIHFVNLYQGSICLLQKDSELLTIRFVDLNADAISLPPESPGELIVEVEFSTPGLHYIDCTIVTTANDQIPFVQFGGGLRSVELCGFTSMPAIAPPFRFTEECVLEYYDGVEWVAVSGWTEFAPACFIGPPGADGAPGADGTNGTNGTNGTDGIDFVPTPFSLIGSAEGNVLLWDLLGGLVGSGLVTDFGIVLGEHVPPDLPCDLDNCQIANVTLQWISGNYFPNAMIYMGEFSAESFDSRLQKLLNVIDIHMVDYPAFVAFAQEIFDIFSVIDDGQASVNAYITYGTNYIVNSLPNVLVCHLSDCGYMTIATWAAFLADLPTDEHFKTLVNQMIGAFGELAFAAITSMAKNSRLVDSFMIPCDPCATDICVVYDFTTAPFNSDWNIIDGTWIDGFGYSPPSGNDAIRLNMSPSPDIEMTYIKISGTNPSGVDDVIIHVDANSGRILDATISSSITPFNQPNTYDPPEVTNLIEIELITDGDNPCFLTEIEIHYTPTGGAPFGGNSC